MARNHARSRLELARERMYRELVFESAEHVIAAKGLEATTMQEIAGEAGISLRTLYAAFPSKEELVAEVADTIRKMAPPALSINSPIRKRKLPQARR